MKIGNVEFVTSFNYMFVNTPQLKSLDLSNFNPINGKMFSSMFQSSGLESLKFVNFNTKSAIDMKSMFENNQFL